jgi:hypothetical protein
VCADQPIAKPIIALGQWKRVLADVAKGLARRPNVVADDFKDRITDRAAVQDFCHFASHVICPNPPRPRALYCQIAN